MNGRSGRSEACAADLFGYQGCVLKSFDGGLPSLDAGR